MPPRAKAHQNQFPAKPFLATNPVTAKGVSAAKVVATIDVPANHQGNERPETKYSLRLRPARKLKATPIPRGQREVTDNDRPVEEVELHAEASCRGMGEMPRILSYAAAEQ